ncbi:MAG TPA: SIMPL domain-containing protein [Methylomirabilota bacterium]|nr:SIMPL domain-containing protein [Methylomirabilota bacterium]
MSDARQPADPPAGTIVVSGTGRVSVEPDLADLRLGVTVARPTVEAARATAATTMDAILAAVAQAGVERRDVRTALLSVQPRYEYRENQPPALAGYDLSNVVEVTVRDLARLGAVVDGTLGAGATSLDQLTFRLADPEPAEREARLRAVAAARARADVLAEGAGVSIVGVSDIVEAGGAPVPMPHMKAERMMLAADAATPVEAGSMDVAVTVSVTYRTR